MAENGNRGPNEPSLRRSQSGRKRREPPIIDATANEVSATGAGREAGAAAPRSEPAGPEPREGAAAGNEAVPVVQAEPVLFGAAVRDGSAGVETAPSSETGESPAGTASSFEPPPEVDPVQSSAAERADPDAGTVTPDAVSAAHGGTVAPPQSRPSRRSLLSILLGIVVLALLGSIAGLLYTGPQWSHSDELSASIATLQGRVAALEARPDAARADAEVAAVGQRTGALDSQLESLKKSVADLETRLDAVAADTNASAAKLSALGQAASASAQPTDVATLSDKVDDLARRLAASQNQPQPAAPAQPPVDVGPIEGRIAGLDQRLADLDRRSEELGGAVAALPKLDLAPLQASVAAVEHRLAPLEAALATPKAADRVTEARAQGSAEETRAAPLAVVAQALSQALAEGRPFTSELEALRTLGVEDATLARLTPLATRGAPTVETLRARWTGLEGNIVAASRPKGSDTILDRFADRARSLVQVRRVDAAAGEDPGSVVRRIDAALDRDELAGALAEWAKLPVAGRQASQYWADAVRGRLDAETTARGLVSRAIMTLAKAKG